MVNKQLFGWLIWGCKQLTEIVKSRVSGTQDYNDI